MADPAKANSSSRHVIEPTQEMALVLDENGRALLVPEDPRDVFNDPFANFTEWDGEADHKAYDKL